MSDASTLPLRLARIGAQRLTDATRLGPDPAAIARAMCTAQAQSFDAARHQLRVRSTGISAASVDRAFEQERSVVRTWLMRGTLHLCAADDLRWMLDVLGANSNRLGEESTHRAPAQRGDLPARCRRHAQGARARPAATTENP